MEIILQMANIGYKHSHRSYSQYLMFLFSTTAILFCCIMLAYYTWHFSSIWKTHTVDYILMDFIHIIVSTFTRLEQTTMVFVYSYLLWSIRKRYRLLNFAVRNTMSRLHNATSHELIELLTSLSKLHDNLTEGVENINTCYSFQVIRFEIHDFVHLINTSMIVYYNMIISFTQMSLYLICSFACCVVSIFSIYRTLLQFDESATVLPRCMWMIFHISNIVALLYVATTTCHEVNMNNAKSIILMLNFVVGDIFSRDGTPLTSYTS